MALTNFARTCFILNKGTMKYRSVKNAYIARSETCQKTNYKLHENIVFLVKVQLDEKKNKTALVCKRRDIISKNQWSLTLLFCTTNYSVSIGALFFLCFPFHKQEGTVIFQLFCKLMLKYSEHDKSPITISVQIDLIFTISYLNNGYSL